MKFDFIIGNPPYQEETKDTSDTPIYDRFMDGAYEVSDRVELIHPARFLFNAGKTPKKWNQKMLNDEHLKVLFYEQDSHQVFTNAEIKGGVAVTYRDASKKIGPIGTFVSDSTMRGVLNKVLSPDFKAVSSIVYAPESYKFTQCLHAEHPDVKSRLSKGHDYDVTSNIFEKLDDIFFDEVPQNGERYCGIFGRNKTGRAIKWIKRDYICGHENLEKYKVLMAKANGAGDFGETLSEPVVIAHGIGHTQSFISVGKFETEFEAQALVKYIKSKFARALLGTAKVTQDNKKGVWRNVPIQNFTPDSDIDWSKPIAEIDRQLYAKYSLDEKEIAFIESHVKAME